MISFAGFVVVSDDAFTASAVKQGILQHMLPRASTWPLDFHGFFPVLRVLADRKPLPARFLILGSASSELLRQSSESLAGRLETIPVAGFGLAEVGPKALSRHWQRGGFPLSFLS